jgi:alkyl hydroperoxide reductase subunit AhpC
VATLLFASQTSAGTQRTAHAVQHTLTSPSLRAWLAGDWAIIFSHPDDFVRYDLEIDRWLVVTQRAFAARGIRPIALHSPALDPAGSWVAQVIGDSRTVLLEDPTQQHFGPVDLATPVLRAALEQAGQRFVMIIDSELRQQKMFSYATLSGLPSPLEFLGWAEALRAKQIASLRAKQASLGEIVTVGTEASAAAGIAATGSAGAGRETLASGVPAHPFFAARRHKHRVPQVACTPTVHARAV